MGIVDGGGLRGLRQSAFELMMFNRKLAGPMFSSQSAVAPGCSTPFDFFPSLPGAATVFATDHSPFLPDIPSLLDSTEILTFLRMHHPRPIDMKQGIQRVDRDFAAQENTRQGNSHEGTYPWESITPKGHSTTL